MMTSCRWAQGRVGCGGVTRVTCLSVPKGCLTRVGSDATVSACAGVRQSGLQLADCVAMLTDVDAACGQSGRHKGSCLGARKPLSSLVLPAVKPPMLTARVHPPRQLLPASIPIATIPPCQGSFRGARGMGYGVRVKREEA